MALPPLDNVTATIGADTSVVTIAIGVDGLLVGRSGKLPWSGATVVATVAADGCRVTVTPAGGPVARLFVPVESFADLGGPRSMKAFVMWLYRSAAAAGASVDQPAA